MSSVLSLPRRTSFVAPLSDWVAVGPELWVAVCSGLRQGQVDRRDGLFTATDDFGTILGTFTTLRAAMAAVAQPAAAAA